MSWTLIEHQALTSSAASVTLGSGGTIPQTYKTLILLTSLRTTANADSAIISFNGNTSNRTSRSLYGNGSAVASGNYTNQFTDVAAANTYTASTFSNGVLTIPNYSGSTNKPSSSDGVNENNATVADQWMFANLWSNTAAITSITLAPSTGNWASGCTFTLYGLA